MTDTPLHATPRLVDRIPAAMSKPSHTDGQPVLDRAQQEAAYRDSGYDLQSHVAHLVRRVHQRATLCFQQVMVGDALSPTQFAALATILNVGEISQNHLGRLTAMDPSTISLVVRKLLKEKLVDRRSSDSDQRLTILRLTDKGARYTIVRLSRSVEVGERLLSPLNKAEQAIFVDLLGRIADSGADQADQAR